MHLAIKERHISSEYLAIHDRKSPVCLAKGTIQKENVFVYVLSHTWDILIYGIFCFLLMYVSHIDSYDVGFYYCTEILCM
jgi:hypothetical protein